MFIHKKHHLLIKLANSRYFNWRVKPRLSNSASQRNTTLCNQLCDVIHSKAGFHQELRGYHLTVVHVHELITHLRLSLSKCRTKLRILARVRLQDFFCLLFVSSKFRISRTHARPTAISPKKENMGVLNNMRMCNPVLCTYLFYFKIVAHFYFNKYIY